MYDHIFLLDFIEKFHKNYLSLRKPDFEISTGELYEDGKKIKKNHTAIIDKLKEELSNKHILLFTDKKDRDNNPITLAVTYSIWHQNFQFTLLPTEYEAKRYAEREALRRELFEKELIERILRLTPYQSVELINQVLDSERAWIKEFKPGKKTRDGGRDFTAKICVTKDHKIAYNGKGKFYKMFGELKHLKGKMGSGEIRKLIGAMTGSHSKIKYGMAISSRGFSPDSRVEIDDAKTSKSNLINEIFCEDASFIAKLVLKNKYPLKKVTAKTSYFIDKEIWDEITELS